MLESNQGIRNAPLTLSHSVGPGTQGLCQWWLPEGTEAVKDVVSEGPT